MMMMMMMMIKYGEKIGQSLAYPTRASNSRYIASFRNYSASNAEFGPTSHFMTRSTHLDTFPGKISTIYLYLYIVYLHTDRQWGIIHKMDR